MKFEPSCNYKRIDQTAVGGLAAVVWISRDPEDTCWDNFLQQTPLGQFQQSTIWARGKRPEGWKPLRVLVTVEDEIVAGFQILWRSSWRGRLAYVSKGPVVLPGHCGLAEYATALLQKVAREEGFRALVVQPPDLCLQTSDSLASKGFMLDVLASVNDATWIIDLRDGFEAVSQRMHKETRQKAKQAINRGVAIREGGREDLETFFDLMLSTCRRQKVAPNPADVQQLLALWDAAQPGGCLRLFFAEYDGRPLTGVLCIAFGKTVTGWKRGWASVEGHRHPNDLGVYEALKWATLRGYEYFDFCAVDRQIAIAMLRPSTQLSPEQKHSRHLFHIRFGGSPRFLPEARVYFPNPLIRLAYRAFFHKKLRRAEEDCRFIQRSIKKWQGLELVR